MTAPCARCKLVVRIGPGSTTSHQTIEPQRLPCWWSKEVQYMPLAYYHGTNQSKRPPHPPVG
jgi:hypothetical protein